MNTEAPVDLTEQVTGARQLSEGGLRYLHIQGLRLPPGSTPPITDGLLCLDPRDGYPTRLFLADQINAPGKNLNWNGSTHVLGRNWVAISWSNVSNTQPALQILLAHLDAFR